MVLGGGRLDDLDLDRPIPPERLLSPDDAPDASRATSRYRNFHAMAVEGLSLRQMMTRREQGLGHGVVVGTAAQVADHMQRWVQERACDGFALTPVTVPEGLDQICDALVPELQRRGLFHGDYPGSTLRANLGLPRPDGGAGQPTSG